MTAASSTGEISRPSWASRRALQPQGRSRGGLAEKALFGVAFASGLAVGRDGFKEGKGMASGMMTHAQGRGRMRSSRIAVGLV